MKARFAGGVEEILSSLALRLTHEAGVADSAARTRAVDLLTRMVGAVVLARALPDSTPLGGEILQTTLAACLDEIGD